MRIPPQGSTPSSARSTPLAISASSRTVASSSGPSAHSGSSQQQDEDFFSSFRTGALALLIGWGILSSEGRPQNVALRETVHHNGTVQTVQAASARGDAPVPRARDGSLPAPARQSGQDKPGPVKSGGETSRAHEGWTDAP